MENPETVWKIINSHFEENPQSLVRHHIDSYDDFFKTGIFQIFKEKNPITLTSKYDESIGDYRHKCIMYFGGKDGKKIYFGKPVIYDNDNSHYMFPNEARLRNMTYGLTVHYDIDIEFIDILEPGQAPYVIGSEILDKKTVGGYELDEIQDYSEELKREREQKAGNYKTKKTDELQGQQEDDDLVGGGPNGQQKPRRKRTSAPEVQMTPAIAAFLREANEKSMVNPNTQKREFTLEKILLGKFPIMVQSSFCILNKLPREIRFSMGECKNDIGGYFIIDGKEKTVVPQEKFADNMLYIRKYIKDEEAVEQVEPDFLYSAEIRSVSENASKPVRTFSVKIMAPKPKLTNKNIVVNIPNVRAPIPLFIVFRALGIISDKDIITMCLLDLTKYESMIDIFIPSVHDAGGIMLQQTALQYIASFTKYNTTSYALEVLADFFLPHIGEINFIQKAYYLGYVVFRLLSVYTGLELPTDRDNFKYKRIELVGSLVYDLFREYYTIQQRQVHLDFEKSLYYNQSMYADNLFGLITQNYREVFRDRIVETGFRKAFKGNWGAQTHTKRIGVVQDLNRLSFNSVIGHLRKTNLSMDAGAKLVGPRVLHSSQWGFIDPIDTPDGGNIGLHKSLAMMTHVSQAASREPIIKWLREKVSMKLVEECGPALLSKMTKVIVNGLWAGSVADPVASIKHIKLCRRNALIPIYTSATFEIRQNTIFIYTDAGRLCRPIFYKDDETGLFPFMDKANAQRLEDGAFTWMQLTTGFNQMRELEKPFLPEDQKIYELYELYHGIESETNPARIDRFLKNKAVIDYIDVSESENALIAVNPDLAKTDAQKFTHSEIHESLILGVMCNQIIFPENNPPTRNSFSCGQSKQAVSLYHTNFQFRMDKTATVLNSGQIPLVKSRYMEYINHEENPYGENAIVAIMCYTGYNVEDAILVNEGALKRGLFRTTYYSTYEAHEENSKRGDVLVDKRFTNIESEQAVAGTKPGYDYSKLDQYGIVRENTEINDKTILIGLTSNNMANPEVRLDASKGTKKGQLGIVDKTFMTEGAEGERIAKVRIREERVPNLGDKMASRSGQKGTIGLIVKECDMPFTKDGLRPDLIINPHALPSRMTIGQLVECVTGKACAIYGGYGDCTAFNNKGSKIGVFGELLAKSGYHSSGNEILYNGMTGQQIETEIYIGPTYYMRLKHMVKDKVNYRALGPRTALTRQPVSGRANDGGLRIGEMERDVLISHGATNFLRESMMERGDKYYMAVCNTTGMIAIYNPSKELFMSPMADGPIRFTGSLADSANLRVENVTKFGRSFSVISVPYSLKLLIHELQTMNIQMRIITDDNIQQLENMSYSKNIEKLVDLKGNKTIPQMYVERMNGLLKTAEINAREKANILETPPASLASASAASASVNSGSPVYEPTGDLVWAEGSPAYEPDGDSGSPAYEPAGDLVWAEGSPAYEPGNDSAEYNPNLGTSPTYEPNTSPTYEANASPTYEAYSPDFSPPDNLSPSDNLSKPDSGQKIGSHEYKAGEQVLYRGGNKASRLWNVKHSGPNFITISTDDLDGFDSLDDSIQVVSARDIFRPTPELLQRAHMYQQRQAAMPNMMPQQNFIPHSEPQRTPDINIKIVNGNDNSTNDESNKETGPNIQVKEPIKIKKGGEAPANEPIDFNKLVIKKLD